MLPEPAPLQGHLILVVEDDYLVGQLLVEILEDAGAEVIGPIGWIDEVLAFLKQDTRVLDGALLDINLHGEKSYPIADSLISRAVPIVFATGYGSSVIEAKYARYPRCEKPFSQGAVISALSARTNPLPS